MMAALRGRERPDCARYTCTEMRKPTTGESKSKQVCPISRKGEHAMKIPAFGINIVQQKPVQVQRLNTGSCLSSVTLFLPGGNTVTGTGAFGETNQGKSKMNGILGKLQLGKRQKSYLRTHSPLYHQKALLVEQERKQYRSELKQCKSKQDVKKLRDRKMMEFSAQSHSIDKAPHWQAEKPR